MDSYVLVKFHDPQVGRISRVSVEGDAEAVPIELVMTKFMASHSTKDLTTFTSLLGCYYSQSARVISLCCCGVHRIYIDGIHHQIGNPTHNRIQHV